MNVILLILVLLYVAALFVPYLESKEVSQEYTDTFDPSQFYSDTPSGKRAMIIEDNGEALEERLRFIANAKHSIILIFNQIFQANKCWLAERCPTWRTDSNYCRRVQCFRTNARK